MQNIGTSKRPVPERVGASKTWGPGLQPPWAPWANHIDHIQEPKFIMGQQEEGCNLKHSIQHKEIILKTFSRSLMVGQIWGL